MVSHLPLHRGGAKASKPPSDEGGVSEADGGRDGTEDNPTAPALPEHLPLHRGGIKAPKSPPYTGEVPKFPSLPLMREVARRSRDGGRDPKTYIKDVINLSDPDRSKQKRID